MFSIETGVIALECIGNKLCCYRNPSFLAALIIIGSVYLSSLVECFREKDVVFACHAILPNTIALRSVRMEDWRRTTTGYFDGRLRRIGVIFDRENAAIMRFSIFRAPVALIVLGGLGACNTQPAALCLCARSGPIAGIKNK